MKNIFNVQNEWVTKRYVVPKRYKDGVLEKKNKIKCEPKMHACYLIVSLKTKHVGCKVSHRHPESF